MQAEEEQKTTYALTGNLLNKSCKTEEQSVSQQFF